MFCPVCFTVVVHGFVLETGSQKWLGFFNAFLETLFKLAGVSSLFTVQPPKQLHQ